MIDISIVVPTYKPMAYLYECLDSLSNQITVSFTYEVIIVLNGSDDSYKCEIENYLKRKKLTNFIFFALPNPGVSYARNLGIQKAKGNYLFFMDDDDILNESYFELLFKHVKPNRLVCGNMKNFEQDISETENSYMSKLFVNNNLEEGTIIKFKRVFSICTGKLIPKSSINNTLFDTKIQIGEDSLFMSTISDKIQDVVLVKNAIYFRRIRLGSAMGQKKSFKYQLKNSKYLISKHLNVYLSNFKNYSFIFFTVRILAILKGFIWRSVFR
ncbi:Glycosyl transferase family 2 [Maribacter sedimenticola]|uniref:Glycosyl transferase family 2 n=1 Tax=Maribacter sedimenticola TaxID=228956 RepID=A0ABY1SJV7_9FLAO|nr:glycosyltransferase family 2 protein [Maribacter sedimenticola]SNR66779.1 Glycosyl transferase family 2 [Maribacter sedimenticola]